MHNVVSKIIRKYDPSLKIRSIMEFGEGYNNIAFKVTTDKVVLVVKLIKRAESEKNIILEKSAFEYLSKRFPELNVPKIFVIDISKSLVRHAYVISEYKRGVPLNRMLGRIKNKKKIFTELGESRAKIHSKKYLEYGQLNEDLGIGKDYNPVSKIENKAEASLQNNRYSERISRFWKENKKYLRLDKKPCLCQGDAGMSNYLVTTKDGKHRISALLDFEFAHSGLRLNDLVTSYAEFPEVYRILPALEQGYNRYGRLPKNWKKAYLVFQFARFLNEIDKAETQEFRNISKKALARKRKIMKSRSRKFLRFIIEEFSKL